MQPSGMWRIVKDLAEGVKCYVICSDFSSVMV
jgi:hypothetical protein